MDKQRRLEILLEENHEMTYFKERDFKKIEEELKAEKAIYETALAEVQPWRIATAEVLNGINKTDLSELSSFTNPPRVIQILCHCFDILRGLEVGEVSQASPIHWADYRFMKSLRELDMDSLTNKQTETIKGLLGKVSKEEMAKISLVGVKPLEYLHTVMDYCHAAREIHLNKKRDALAKIQDKYNQKKRKLDKMKEDRVSMEMELQELTVKDDSGL